MSQNHIAGADAYITVETGDGKHVVPSPEIAFTSSSVENNNEVVRVTPTVSNRISQIINGNGDQVAAQVPSNAPSFTSIRNNLFFMPDEERQRKIAAFRRLKYQKDYPIERFGRKWTRDEATGFFCLALEAVRLKNFLL